MNEKDFRNRMANIRGALSTISMVQYVAISINEDTLVGAIPSGHIQHHAANIGMQ